MIKTCINCNREYNSIRDNQKYCSRKCISSYAFKKNRKPKLLKLRFNILARDNFKCVYCGRNPVEHNTVLHIDHRYPKSKGGSDTADNFVTACAECNMGKSNTVLGELTK